VPITDAPPADVEPDAGPLPAAPVVLPRPAPPPAPPDSPSLDPKQAAAIRELTAMATLLRRSTSSGVFIKRGVVRRAMA
jgi:hypothetical protein